MAGGPRAGPPDHPRVYGEHPADNQANTVYSGSPPRVRGARHQRRTRRITAGITPACTGSTVWNILDGVTHMDHPRVYGEHVGAVATGGSFNGSPPRVRGAPGTHTIKVTFARITPACTGSTPAPGRTGGCRSDHPRVYGEHAAPNTSAASVDGSPPRVRGARVPGDLVVVGGRITPACTGSTYRPVAEWVSGADHPRVYGEHRRAPTAGPRGSDHPRVYGEHARRH